MVSQGASDIARPLNILILGGSNQASDLAKRCQAEALSATFSYAGRVKALIPQPLPTRVGGFGGMKGLVAYLDAQAITHVVDATHPFAAQMSQNAIAACAQTNTPLIALTRPAWRAQKGDRWQNTPDITGAVASLNGPARRVLLATGRQNLDAFAAQPQHHYVLRMIERPEIIPLLNHTVVLARGPFTYEGDRALIEEHRIEIIVSKNSGGQAARAKLDVARDLKLPVIMIDRPKTPARCEVYDVAQVMAWFSHDGTDRGV